MTREEAIDEVRKLVAAPSCCKEAKAAGEAYLRAIGTDQEKSAAKELLKELEEDVTSIEDLIALARSEQGIKIFGADRAGALLEQAEKAKAAGGRYCVCPACQAGGKLLEHPEALL
ncbi:MAG: molecular chaperone Hsp90 [Lactimicrobium massiliense]|nr:molecular chaperone Hsp90 [Lactimicrobium massiliense]MDD6457602.1 molecular chaperone Hsp90 [Lactimicrobium massiliense]